MHTPFTTRAMELMQLYNGLNLPMLTIDQRLDVLLHVKWTVKEFDCNLTRELVGLIEREADLLNRGRNVKLLEGLRKRISSLFLTFIETPGENGVMLIACCFSFAPLCVQSSTPRAPGSRLCRWSLSPTCLRSWRSQGPT